MDIEICKTCGGQGEVEHRNDYNEKELISCSKCNGTGRVLTRTLTYTVPFDSDIQKVYKYDKKIIELIRELEK